MYLSLGAAKKKKKKKTPGEGGWGKGKIIVFHHYRSETIYWMTPCIGDMNCFSPHL